MKLNDKWTLSVLDEKNLVVTKRTIARTGKNVGEEVIRTKGYYRCVEHAIEAIVNEEMNTAFVSDDLNHVLDEISKLKQSILAELRGSEVDWHNGEKK